MIEQLAKITDASLTIQENGILSFSIWVEYENDGSVQNIGGYTLDNYSEKLKTRVGTAYGCEIIRRLLLELGVNDFSEMKDKVIWVIGIGNDNNFKVKGIRSLNINRQNNKNKGVIFEEIAQTMILKT